MRALKFQVDGQVVKRSPGCDFDNITRGTKRYLKLQFSLSKDWAGCVVAATFWNYEKEVCAVQVKNGMCAVPDEVTDNRRIKVSLTGKRGDYKIVTNKIVIRQEG